MDPINQKILAIDVGNTNVVVGVMNGYEVMHSYRIPTTFEALNTMDKHIELTQIRDINRVVGASVVPHRNLIIENWMNQKLKLPVQWINAQMNLGFKILYQQPQQVGADRIANTLAVIHRYTVPAIVVDFGTAVTFDLISADKEYLGGYILPGVGLAAKSLKDNTALLPDIEVEARSFAIGQDTASSMQLGIFWGWVDMIQGLLKRISQQVFFDKKVFKIATGGHSQLFKDYLSDINVFDIDLTLKGLFAASKILP